MFKNKSEKYNKFSIQTLWLLVRVDWLCSRHNLVGNVLCVSSTNIYYLLTPLLKHSSREGMDLSVRNILWESRLSAGYTGCTVRASLLETVPKSFEYILTYVFVLLYIWLTILFLRVKWQILRKNVLNVALFIIVNKESLTYCYRHKVFRLFTVKCGRCKRLSLD